MSEYTEALLAENFRWLKQSVRNDISSLLWMLRELQDNVLRYRAIEILEEYNKFYETLTPWQQQSQLKPSPGISQTVPESQVKSQDI